MNKTYMGLLVFWGIVLALLTWFFERQGRPPSHVEQGGEIVSRASHGGHHLIAGSIGGQPIRWLIDTGASKVSISERIAKAAGLPKGEPARFRTAGGEVNGSEVTGVRVQAGPIVIDELTVSVLPDHGDDNIGLLGQNFLHHVDLVQQGERLVLRAKATNVPPADR